MLDPKKTTEKSGSLFFFLPLGGEVLINRNKYAFLGSTHKQSKFIAGNSTKECKKEE
jgi:hypothetical protein